MTVQVVIGYVTVPGRAMPAKVLGLFDGPTCVGVELEPIPVAPKVADAVNDALAFFWAEARRGRVHVYDEAEQRTTEVLPMPRSKTVGMIVPTEATE